MFAGLPATIFVAYCLVIFAIRMRCEEIFAKCIVATLDHHSRQVQLDSNQIDNQQNKLPRRTCVIKYCAIDRCCTRKRNSKCGVPRTFHTYAALGTCVYPPKFDFRNAVLRNSCDTNWGMRIHVVQINSCESVRRFKSIIQMSTYISPVQLYFAFLRWHCFCFLDHDPMEGYGRTK